MAYKVIVESGAVGVPGMAFEADPDSGLYLVSEAVIGVTLAGAQVARFTASSLVLAGTLETGGSAKSTSATGGVGYATGAGGTVAQGSGSGKATAVTLNNVCGEVTMDGAALAGNNAVVTFEMTNSAAAEGDLVLVNHPHAGTVGAYVITADADAGHIHFHVTNITHGSLSEAIVLRFAIIKGVTS